MPCKIEKIEAGLLTIHEKRAKSGYSTITGEKKLTNARVGKKANDLRLSDFPILGKVAVMTVKRPYGVFRHRSDILCS